MSYLSQQRFEGPCRLCSQPMIRLWGNPQVCGPCLERLRNPPPRVTWYQRLAWFLRRMT